MVWDVTETKAGMLQDVTCMIDAQYYSINSHSYYSPLSILFTSCVLYVHCRKAGGMGLGEGSRE